MRSGAARWLAAAVLVAACAHVEPPPGGPEDRTPPQLLTSRPDTLAVEPGWEGPVVLVFDERVSEQGVEDAVAVSPRTSAVVVDHSGDEIRVSLREGWVPGTIYHVTLLPGVQDLFQNPLTQPIQFVFSTGPEIPDTRAGGEVVDPITGQPEQGARVEAVRQPDSLVYAIPTDSAGRFVLARIPEGEYLLRAYRDLNQNRRLDAYEPRDSATATVAVGDSVGVELGLLEPDSTAPVVASAEVQDGRVTLSFDDYLDPEQRLPPARVQITSPDGVFVGVSRIGVGRLEEEAAADTAQERPDTAQAARPLPSQTLVVELDEEAELEPGVEYRVRVTGIRNVVGLGGDSETTFTAPEGEESDPLPAAADTAVADTAAASPAGAWLETNPDFESR